MVLIGHEEKPGEDELGPTTVADGDNANLSGFGPYSSKKLSDFALRALSRGHEPARNHQLDAARLLLVVS